MDFLHLPLYLPLKNTLFCKQIIKNTLKIIGGLWNFNPSSFKKIQKSSIGSGTVETPP